MAHEGARHNDALRAALCEGQVLPGRGPRAQLLIALLDALPVEQRLVGQGLAAVDAPQPFLALRLADLQRFHKATREVRRQQMVAQRLFLAAGAGPAIVIGDLGGVRLRAGREAALHIRRDLAVQARLLQG